MKDTEQQHMCKKTALIVNIEYYVCYWNVKIQGVSSILSIYFAAIWEGSNTYKYPLEKECNNKRTVLMGHPVKAGNMYQQK